MNGTNWQYIVFYCYGFGLSPFSHPLSYYLKCHSQGYIISYPLSADADTGIYPHAASQYHARPNAKRGIAMLSVDKFSYPRKQTRGNEFIPCLNDVCQILKPFP